MSFSFAGRLPQAGIVWAKRGIYGALGNLPPTEGVSG